MNNARREQLTNILKLRDTEDLLEIWQEYDTDGWKAEVFEIIRGILLERLGYLPPQSIQGQVNEVLDRVENYLQSSEFDKALRECELAIQMAPNLAIAHDYRGRIYDEMGQTNKAIAAFQKAVRLDPGFEDAWNSLNDLQIDLDEEFQQSSIKKQLDRALAYAYDDQPQRALQECELARLSVPSVATAHNYLGMIFEELDQLESAVQEYLAAILLNPRFSAARENLANARLRLEEELYYQPAPEIMKGMQGERGVIPSIHDSEESAISDGLDSVPPWIYMDRNAFLLRGWPGHRTRPGRTGYDPLDADFENARMEGIVARLLFTCKFRTHNPIYLILMSGVGFMFCSPLLFAGMTLSNGYGNSIFLMLLFSPHWIVGIALLMNVILSLGAKKSDERVNNGREFF
jgi:tetratricopeptide (TPR) repeat protein